VCYCFIDLDNCTVSVVSNGTISNEEGHIGMEQGLTAEECRERCELNPDCEEASFRFISSTSSVCILYDKQVSRTYSAGAGSFHYRKTCTHGKCSLVTFFSGKVSCYRKWLLFDVF